MDSRLVLARAMGLRLAGALRSSDLATAFRDSQHGEVLRSCIPHLSYIIATTGTAVSRLACAYIHHILLPGCLGPHQECDYQCLPPPLWPLHSAASGNNCLHSDAVGSE